MIHFNCAPAKTLLHLCFFILFSATLFGQTTNQLTIETCYRLAKENYPLINQLALLDKSREYNLQNASKGYLPQINIAGQASYQSEVTSFPISLPNVIIPEPSKDQYKIYGEIYEPLTDFTAINRQKDLVNASTELEKQKIEVELYKLKERINQLYFGILLIDAQLEQNGLLIKDLNAGIEKVKASIQNGTAIQSSSDLLKAESLKAEQHAIELRATRKGFADMLAIFIKLPVNETTSFQMPETVIPASQINRPELKVFDLQKATFNVQSKQLSNRSIPRLGLFFQGGYGRPALNVLDDNFNGYYIGGLKLNWNLSAFYTLKNERQNLALSNNNLDFQRETFLLNTNLALVQLNSESEKLTAVINTDNDIIEVRNRIKKTAENQLKEGIISPLDFVSFLDAEDQAKQNLILHQIQLKLSQYNQLTSSGN